MRQVSVPLAIVALAWSPAVGQERLPDLVKRITPATVTISTTGSLGQAIGSGSGFFLSDTLVVTNFHVVEGASAAVVKLASGEAVAAEGLAAVDEAHDLALLSLPRPTAPRTHLRLQPMLPEPGERVVVIGSPDGLEQSVSDGLVSAVRVMSTYGQVIQTTAATSPGSSGSPVLNMRGEVVGVHCFAVRAGDGLKFAIPARHVAALRPGDVKPLGQLVPGLDSTPPDVPKAVLKQFAPAHAGLLRKQAKWYVRLPDGRCVNVYRALRICELLSSTSGNASQELEALGYTRTDETVRYEELPPWHQPSDGWILCSGLAQQRTLRVDAVADAVALASVRGERDAPPLSIYVTGDWRSPPTVGSTVNEPVVLIPLGDTEVNGNTLPAYRLLNVSDHHPTPAQLGFAVMQRKAQIVQYSYTRSVLAPTRMVGRPGHGRPEPAGPSTKIYTWRCQPVQLRWRSAPVELDPPDQGSPPQPAAERTAPAAPDRLALRDGRVLWGRLVEDGADRITFVVVIGGIESSMQFARSEVETLDRDVR